MKPVSFVGCAGTGKTTALLDAVRNAARATPLLDGQQLLAITRMNGARRRIDARLRVGASVLRYDCRTIDSLAWMIASRWRLRAELLGFPRASELDFDGTCRVAAGLLDEPDVAAWLSATYPVVMVDECQDCCDDRLLLVQRLASATNLFVAADNFQNLDSLDSSAVTWIRDDTNLQELEKVHRTDRPALLEAAKLLREFKSLPQGWNTRGNGFSLVSTQNANPAAKLLVQQIAWSGGKETVVLSPTGPASSPFVAKVLSRAASLPAFVDKNGNAFKTYDVPWEDSAATAVKRLLEAVEKGALATTHLPGATDLVRWMVRQRRIAGRTSFTNDELRAAAERAVQHHRAHARPTRRLRGMTIHQAKNQEFERVVILWPLKVAGKGEHLSRLLYNAVTRAKVSAVVIVQDLKDRLSEPPFTHSSEAQPEESPESPPAP